MQAKDTQPGSVWITPKGYRIAIVVNPWAALKPGQELPPSRRVAVERLDTGAIGDVGPGQELFDICPRCDSAKLEDGCRCPAVVEPLPAKGDVPRELIEALAVRWRGMAGTECLGARGLLLAAQELEALL